MLEVGCKIGFYSIEVVKGDEVLNPALFVKLVEFISQLTEEDRIQDLERDKILNKILNWKLSRTEWPALLCDEKC